MINLRFFQRLRPIHRSIISITVAAVVYLLLPSSLSVLLSVLMCWIAFALVYIICCWLVIYSLPVAEIKKNADVEDGSKPFVFSMILVCSFASMFALVMLIVSQKTEQISGAVLIPVALCGMLFSWFLVHTIFIFHYAHMYYKKNRKGAGLSFPGDEEPDYLDFAYFSLVLGCTFQVSDVEITDKLIRRTALFHGLLAFALNTFVVALTINILAGLTS